MAGAVCFGRRLQPHPIRCRLLQRSLPSSSPSLCPWDVACWVSEASPEVLEAGLNETVCTMWSQVGASGLGLRSASADGHGWEGSRQR
eukprot:36989-Rhodomonas_salina.1